MAEAAATDQTREVLPILVGLIGLAGVVVGGIIQAVMQHRNLLEVHAEKIRMSAAELAGLAGAYSSVGVQASREFHRARDEYKQALASDPDAELDIDGDYWDRLADAFMKGFDDVYRKTLELAASRDSKVADHAMTIHHKATDFHNKVSPIFLGKTGVTPDEANVLRDELNFEVSVLATMISPRPIERLVRFRGPNRAKKMIEKSRKKDHSKK